MRLALLACSFALAGPYSCWAQVTDSSVETTIRVDVQLVRILATVKDPAGALVGSLQKNDFAVRATMA